MVSPTVRKDDVIQIRAPRETKSLLMQAALLKGQKLSEFMLESARRTAEETLLDRALFLLDDTSHERLLAVLDAPSPLSSDARVRLTRSAPWQD